MLYHIKLVIGPDYLAYVLEETETTITLQAPVEILYDPACGIYGKSILALSETSTMILPKSMILFVNKASAKAHEYYEAFVHSAQERDQDLDDQLESKFNAILEAKTAIKH